MKGNLVKGKMKLKKRKKEKGKLLCIFSKPLKLWHVAVLNHIFLSLMLEKKNEFLMRKLKKEEGKRDKRKLAKFFWGFCYVKKKKGRLLLVQREGQWEKAKCHYLYGKYIRNKREGGSNKKKGEERRTAEEEETSKKKRKHFSEGKAMRSEGFDSNKKF